MNIELKRLYYNLDTLKYLKSKVDQDIINKANDINIVLEKIISDNSHNTSFIAVEDITSSILKGFK